MMFNLLLSEDVVPDEGELKYRMWSLVFMNTYGKEKTVYSLVNGVNPKLFRKLVWIFIRAIADLRVYVVSSFVFCLPLFIHLFIYLFILLINPLNF